MAVSGSGHTSVPQSGAVTSMGLDLKSRSELRACSLKVSWLFTQGQLQHALLVSHNPHNLCHSHLGSSAWRGLYLSEGTFCFTFFKMSPKHYKSGSQLQTFPKSMVNYVVINSRIVCEEGHLKCHSALFQL